MVEQYKIIKEEFKVYLEARKYTDTHYKHILSFLKFCLYSHIDYENLTIDNLNGYLLYLQKNNIKNGTVNNKIKALRMFYKFLYETKRCKEEVYKIPYTLKFCKKEKRIKDYLTKEELDELMELAPIYLKRMNYDKFKTIVYFLLYTGIRPGEFYRFKRKDINIGKNCAIVRLPTKTGRERIIYFPEWIGEMLDYYFSIEPEKLNAFNMKENSLTYLLSILDYLSDKKITPYIFRHGFAMMLAEKGVEVAQAKELMGHTSIETTLEYYNPTQKMVEKSYREKIK